MTQQATSAGETGGAADSQAGAEGDSQQPDLKLPDNAQALIAPGILATAPKANTDDGTSAAPNAASQAADTGTGDAGATDGAPQDEVATWATTIDEAPQRIVEIPKALQAQVISRWKTDLEAAAIGAVQAVRESEYQRGLAEGRRTVETGSKIERANELFESGDVDAFKEYANKEFGSIQNYHRAVAGLPPAPSEAAASIQTRAKALFDRIKPPPEVEAALKASWNYPATDAGYNQLADDLTAAMVKHATGARAADPAQAAIDQRRNGAEHRATVPRPDTAEGRNSAAGGLPTLAEFNKMSVQEAAEKFTPDQVDQILAMA